MPIQIIESNYEKSAQHILSLLNQGKREFDKSFLDWRYQERPLGCLTVVVAVNEDEQIVGCRSMFPYTFRVRGQEKTFGFQSDLFVDKNHRKLGIGVKLVRCCIFCTIEKGVKTILGMPNALSTKIQKKNQLKQIGVIQGYRRYFDLEYRLSKKISIPILVKAISKITRFFLGMLSPEDSFLDESEYRLIHDNTIGDDFNVLYERLSREIKIVGNRSSDYLSWRYLQHPYKIYEILKLQRFDELVGYVIFQKKEGGRVFVDDIFCSPDAVTCDNLIGRVLLFFKKQKVNEVEIGVSENNPLIPHLLKFRFVPCDDRWSFLVYTADEDDFFYDISFWHLTFGDKDI